MIGSKVMARTWHVSEITRQSIEQHIHYMYICTSNLNMTSHCYPLLCDHRGQNPSVISTLYQSHAWYRCMRATSSSRAEERPYSSLDLLHKEVNLWQQATHSFMILIEAHRQILCRNVVLSLPSRVSEHTLCSSTAVMLASFQVHQGDTYRRCPAASSRQIYQR